MTQRRVLISPKYFDDGRKYEFVVSENGDGSVTVAMFHDPDGLMDEVFGFVLTRQEACAMGSALSDIGNK